MQSVIQIPAETERRLRIWKEIAGKEPAEVVLEALNGSDFTRYWQIQLLDPHSLAAR